MICGQSLQALALRLARASQAGSVHTCGESPEGKRLDTSLTAGGDGVESAISTETARHTETLVGITSRKHHLIELGVRALTGDGAGQSAGLL